MALSLLSFLFLFGCYTKTEAVQVTVEQGVLEGQLVNAVVGGNQYNSFKGIPYAAPPVGSLRFKAPQPPLPWKGVRNATQHGSTCIQNNVFTKIISGTEDCLFLNVYSPNLKPKKPLPVIFFIHGGGFNDGSGDVTEYGPDHLVRRDVVVVTINYRLSAFGFLSMDTKEVPGNAGMKDQVAALRWVQKNIANFGGDPKKVTIMGESAGGVSVILHMVSPMSKGLFKRGIALSGVPMDDWNISFLPTKRAFALGKLLGNDTQDPNVLLDFLQSVPFETIPTVDPRLLIAETLILSALKMYNFVPVAEKDFGQERFLVEDFETTLKRNSIGVDVMIGYNSEESALGIPVLINQALLNNYTTFPELYVPRKISQETSPRKVLEIADMVQKQFFNDKNNVTMREFITYSSQSFVTFDILRYIQIASRSSAKQYAYRFSTYSDRNIYSKPALEFGIKGAAHKEGLLYLFEPMNANFTTAVNSKEFELIERVTKLITNFAKYGNPTPDNEFGVTWPVYDIVGSYLEFGNELSVGTQLGADIMAFWKSVYKYSGLDTLFLI